MEKKIMFYFLVLWWVSGAVENEYTFDGKFTYEEVLKSIATLSKRSVIGSTEALNIYRTFYINRKKFSTAIEQINKNLVTDGYFLTYNENEILVTKMIEEKGIDTVYQVYMPYANRYIVTKDKQEFLNAKKIDRENFIIDSLESAKKDTIYEVDIFILGYTSIFSKSTGIDINNSFGINLDVNDKKLTVNGVTIDVSNIKTNDDKNFVRNIKTFFHKDTSISLIFGSENR